MPPVVIAGTRPEIIKLWPVWERMREVGADPIWLHSGQHDTLAFPLYEALGIKPSLAVELPRRSGELSELGSLLLDKLGAAISTLDPSIVLVQGDTHTVLYAALAAFYSGIPIGHVEAGLRTYNLSSPWPEEANRQMVARIADLHFCPNSQASLHLRRENIRQGVYEVGNTIVDAIQRISDGWTYVPKEHALVTLHRRENIDDLPEILEAVERLASAGMPVIFPVHASPAVSSLVYRALQGVKGVTLSTPMVYPDFVRSLMGARVIITDSGGVQEEAITMRKPLVICRDTSERMEAVHCGLGILAGKETEDILAAVEKALQIDIAHWEFQNPFGDGQAAEYIVETLESGGFLGEQQSTPQKKDSEVAAP